MTNALATLVKQNAAAVETAAKPVAKKAAAKKVVAKKPAAKKPAGKTVRKAPANKVKYLIEDFARPQRGNHLFAFTAAWLDLTGMTVGNAMSREAITKIAGARAVKYHLDNGNFGMTADGIVVTERGIMAFSSRTIDPQLHAAFVEVLTEGKVNEIAHVKSAKHIKAA